MPKYGKNLLFTKFLPYFDFNIYMLILYSS